PFELALDCGELLHDVGAVGVLLHHAQHRIQVAPRSPEPIHDRATVGLLHPTILPHPGWGRLATNRRDEKERDAWSSDATIWCRGSAATTASRPLKASSTSSAASSR